MKDNYDNVQEFAADAVNASRGIWLNGTFTVNGHAVGIKMFDGYVQRLRVGFYPYVSAQQLKTLRDRRAFIVSHFEKVTA